MESKVVKDKQASNQTLLCHFLSVRPHFLWTRPLKAKIKRADFRKERQRVVELLELLSIMNNRVDLDQVSNACSTPTVHVIFYKQKPAGSIIQSHDARSSENKENAASAQQQMCDVVGSNTEYSAAPLHPHPHPHPRTEILFSAAPSMERSREFSLASNLDGSSNSTTWPWLSTMMRSEARTVWRR